MINKHKCQEVILRGNFRSAPCRNQARYYENGKYYCGTHATSKQQERRIKKENSPRWIQKEIRRLERRADLYEAWAESARNRAEPLKLKLKTIGEEASVASN